MKYLFIILLIPSIVFAQCDEEIPVSGSMQHGPNLNHYSGSVCFNWDPVGETWSYTNNVDIQVEDGPFYPSWGDIKIDPSNNEYYYSLDSYSVEFRVNLGIFETGPVETVVEKYGVKLEVDLPTCHMGSGIEIKIFGMSNEGNYSEIGTENMVEDQILDLHIQMPYNQTMVDGEITEVTEYLETITIEYHQDGGIIDTQNYSMQVVGPSEIDYATVFDAFQKEDPECLGYKEIWRAKGYLANPEKSAVVMTFLIMYDDGSSELHAVSVPPGEGCDYQVEAEQDFNLLVSIGDNNPRGTDVTKVNVDLDHELNTYFNVVSNGGWDAETPQAQEDALAGIYVAEILEEIENNDQLRHDEISGLIREQIKSANGDIVLLEKLLEAVNSVGATNEGMQKLLEILTGEGIDASGDNFANDKLSEIADNTAATKDALGDENGSFLSRLVSRFIDDSDTQAQTDWQSDLESKKSSKESEVDAQLRAGAGSLDNLQPGSVSGDTSTIFEQWNIPIPVYGTIDMNPLNALPDWTIPAMAIVREFILWSLMIWFAIHAMDDLSLAAYTVGKTRGQQMLVGIENAAPGVPQIKAGIVETILVGALVALVTTIVVALNSNIALIASAATSGNFTSIADVTSKNVSLTANLATAWTILDLVFPMQALVLVLVLRLVFKAFTFFLGVIGITIARIIKV